MLDSSFLRHLAALTAAISEMAVTVVFGTVFGHWLDGRLGTGPTLMLVLALGSLTAGTFRLKTAIQNLTEMEDSPPSEEP